MRMVAVLVLFPLVSCVSAPGDVGLGLAQKPARPVADLNGSARADAIAHFLVAVMHERHGRFEEAIAELNQALERRPDSPSLLLELLDLYVLTHDFENARSMCERALAVLPEDVILWSRLGWLAGELGDFEAAGEAYEQVLRLDPNSKHALEQLLEASERTNDYIAAIDVCERLVELRPNNPLLHLKLGEARALANDTQGACKAFERAIELEPRLYPAHYLLGLVYFELGMNDKSIEQFERYLKLDAGNPGVHKSMAAALARVGRYEDALHHLDEMGDAAQDPFCQIARMYLLIRAGRAGEAAEADPPAQAPAFGTILRAAALRAAGEDILPLFDALKTVNVDVDAECQEYLSELLYLFAPEKTGEFLVRELESARAAGVKSKAVDLILARVYMQLDRYDEAQALLLSALETYGDDVWTHFYLGSLYYEELDRFADAEPHLLKALEMAPDNAELLNYVGYMYAEQNVHLEKAEALVRRALEMEPDSGFYLDSLGWIRYRQGDADGAIQLIRRAISNMDTDDAVLRDHLGDAYLLKGDAERARAEWERARRLDPELEGVQDKLDTYLPKED